MKRNSSQKILHSFIAAAVVFSSFLIADAQTWNSNAGGYNGGYGQVYQTFGLAMATKNMQDTMNLTMQRTMMRMAMEKKWGKAATAEAMANASRSSSNQTTVRSSDKSVNTADSTSAPQPRVVRNYAVFKPDASVDTGKLFADALGETAEEKALLKGVYAATKIEFEKEVAPRGWKNNFAGALTFFIVTAATVYRDAPEPSDEAVDTLYAALNQVIDETPEFAAIPNRDKQEFYNKMIGFSGILLAGYSEGKETGDQETLNGYRKIAGILIELVLKTNPERVRFAENRLVIN